MIYKRCGRCGKRIPSGTTCECKDKREYAKPTGIKKEYHTQRWQDLREYVLTKHNYIDLYALYKHGKITPADTLHHIETAQDRPDLFYSDSNLISVSRQSHVEIHEKYKAEAEGSIKEELRAYKAKYEAQGGI